MAKTAILRRYLIAAFAPAFGMAIAFFVFILELVDLFANLWKYMSLEVPLMKILEVALLYAPTCVVWALPIAILFAVSFALGNLYASNELVAIFGTGVSLRRFTLPLLAIGVLVSVGSYFFSDHVSLPTYRQKTRLAAKLLGQNPSLSNSDVTVLARQGRVVYHAAFFDDAAKTLSDVTVIERDQAGSPVARIDASSARFQDGAWLFQRVRRFTLDPGGLWKEGDFGTWSDPSFNERAESFRNQNFDLGELSTAELDERAVSQKAAGLPWTATVAERHRRVSFSFAPLVVAMLSAAIGGRYRKNVLLMSLLVSLVISTGYYVFQMVSMLLAKTAVIDPVVGAWSPLAAFALLALFLNRTART